VNVTQIYLAKGFWLGNLPIFEPWNPACTAKKTRLFGRNKFQPQHIKNINIDWHNGDGWLH